MITSNKLKQWIKLFYGYSADKWNLESKYQEEFKELREILKEIRKLEKRLKYLDAHGIGACVVRSGK